MCRVWGICKVSVLSRMGAICILNGSKHVPNGGVVLFLCEKSPRVCLHACPHTHTPIYTTLTHAPTISYTHTANVRRWNKNGIIYNYNLKIWLKKLKWCSLKHDISTLVNTHTKAMKKTWHADDDKTGSNRSLWPSVIVRGVLAVLWLVWRLQCSCQATQMTFIFGGWSPQLRLRGAVSRIKSLVTWWSSVALSRVHQTLRGEGLKALLRSFPEQPRLP